MYRPKLAIIIPTFNRIDETRSIIHQLLKQDFNDYKIVICDSGSSDGTERLDEEFPGLKILHLGANKWWTGATNAGIRYAQERQFSLTLLMNDDLAIPTDLLRRVVSYHHEYPETLLSSMQRDTNGRLYVGSLFQGIFKDRINVLKPDKNPLYIDCSNGCCLLIPTHLFDIIGLTDDNRVPHLGGDVSIFLRARNLGIKCIVIPEIVIEHTSSTDYIRKIELRTIFTHPASIFHFGTYITLGQELYGSYLKFVFLGVKSHYRFIKGILIIIFRSLNFQKINPFLTN